MSATPTIEFCEDDIQLRAKFRSNAVETTISVIAVGHMGPTLQFYPDAVSWVVEDADPYNI